jgi:hypothetical protein
MLSKHQCALLKLAQTVAPVIQVTPKPQPITQSMGQAFKQFSVTEYNRSKY